MRSKLGEYFKRRIPLKAVLHEYGRTYMRNGKPTKSVLLRDIRHAETGAILTDHAFIKDATAFRRGAIEPGQFVYFTAQVRRYMKGGCVRPSGEYSPLEIDYKLHKPEDVKRGKPNW